MACVVAEPCFHPSVSQSISQVAPLMSIYCPFITLRPFPKYLAMSGILGCLIFIN